MSTPALCFGMGRAFFIPGAFLIYCTLCSLAMVDGHCLHMSVDAILMSEDIPGDTTDVFRALWHERLSEAPYKER